MDPIEAARRIIEQRFPEARAALLAGSALTQRRTPTSDLDLVVLLPGRPAPYRETFRAEGWIVEVFAHTRSSLEHYSRLHEAARRPTLLRMCAHGHVLVSHDGQAEAIREVARQRLEAGPPALSGDELAARRYALTDLLDDLEGNQDAAELPYIAALVLQRTAELVLLTQRHWFGAGKWLHRELVEFDAAFAAELVAAHRVAVADGERAPLLEVAGLALDRAGGRLLEGYHDDGEDPDADDEAAPAAR